MENYSVGVCFSEETVFPRESCWSGTLSSVCETCRHSALCPPCGKVFLPLLPRVRAHSCRRSRAHTGPCSACPGHETRLPAWVLPAGRRGGRRLPSFCGLTRPQGGGPPQPKPEFCLGRSEAALGPPWNRHTRGSSSKLLSAVRFFLNGRQSLQGWLFKVVSLFAEHSRVPFSFLNVTVLFLKCLQNLLSYEAGCLKSRPMPPPTPRAGPHLCFSGQKERDQCPSVPWLSLLRQLSSVDSSQRLLRIRTDHLHCTPSRLLLPRATRTDTVSPTVPPPPRASALGQGQLHGP